MYTVVSLPFLVFQIDVQSISHLLHSSSSAYGHPLGHTGLSWEEAVLGYNIHAIPETSNCLVGPTVAEVLITLLMELPLALYPPPTLFLLQLFSSPELGLFNLEKRNCRGIFSVCKIYAEWSNERRQSQDHLGVSREWTRGNEHKPKHRKLHWNLRKSSFVVRMVKHWIRFSREVVEVPSLEVFKPDNIQP
ncbi:hypothetical protein WISP_105958 [Willisornis vidua]|uniref:Maturase K n=1 Tax=Willisornis vidua TaxID=1566151 RepID=A0ABQ9D1X5_9PASS|nr:hypothetical protein WISP_105958 [Willisornis vidua]